LSTKRDTSAAEPQPQKPQDSKGHRHPVVKTLAAIPVALVLPLVIVGRALREIWDDSNSRNILLAAVWLLFAGTIIFMILESLSILDAFYFSFITLATIGYGDIAPQTDLGKIATIIYSVAGLGILAALFATIGSMKLGPRYKGDGRTDDVAEDQA
jgi:voltage-gated potassium channel